MTNYFKTSEAAHKERNRRNTSVAGPRYKVFKVRGRYFVGTDAQWLLAVS